MKKVYTLVLAGLATMSALAQSKFDANGVMILNQYRLMQANPVGVALTPEMLPFDASVMTRADGRASVIAILKDGYGAADIEALGFDVQIDEGNIVMVNGTMSDIAALDDCDFVKALSFGSNAEVKLDKARVGTGADIIHAGTGLNQIYKGAGVITGIYDVGVDPNHVAFLGEDGNTRIAKVMYFSGSGGTCVEYDTPERIASFTTDDAYETHGTHTTACMAGSFNGRGGGSVALEENGTIKGGARFRNPYYGIAPEATLVVGCGQLYSSNYLNAVNRIVNYATSVGKPAVINLSLGNNLGSHDGTDATSQLIDALGQKAIICLSAGNEGDLNMSIDKTLSASETSFTTFFLGNNRSFSGAIDIYSDSSEPFTLTPIVFNTQTKSVVYSYDVTSSTSSAIIATSNYTGANYIHNAVFDQAFTRSNVQIATSSNSGTSNRYSASVYVAGTFNSATNAAKTLVLGFKISGKAGQRIMMSTNSDDAEFTSLGLDGYTKGNSAFSISGLACGKNVLAIGAWNTRKTIPILGSTNMGMAIEYDGDGMDVDSVAGYSSWGKLYDGRTLPHVCAPGTGIISAISTPYYNNASAQSSSFKAYCSAAQDYNGRSNYWEVMQGTSMASPIAAGCIALWLQADPTLDINKVKQVINETSTKDSFVTDDPNPIRWGAGKINALEGLKWVISHSSGVSDVVADNGEVMLSPLSENLWDVYVPAADHVDARLYNMAGQLATSVSVSGSTANLSTEGLAAGVYVLSVNGVHSQRILVK